MCYMAKHVSADRVEIARNVDLIDYLECKGEPLKKEGRYYRLQVHDSLVIKDQMYAWNSRDEKGAGVINFAKMFYGMSFPEAVLDLNAQGYKVKDNVQEKQPKERIKTANKEVEKILIKRIVNENFYLSLIDIKRLLEGKARDFKVKTEELYYEE